MGCFWCLPSSESSPRTWASGGDVFCCGSFPNSWVWTWRSWKKSKKMLGWETEAWAVWQVRQGEGSPLLVQGARGRRVAWLEAVMPSLPALRQKTRRPQPASTPQPFSSVVPSCLLLAGQKRAPSPVRAPRRCSCVVCSTAGRAAAERGCLEPFSSPPCEISHFSEAPKQLSCRQIVGCYFSLPVPQDCWR